VTGETTEHPHSGGDFAAGLVLVTSRSDLPKKAGSKPLRPVGAAVLACALRGTIPIVFDGDELDAPPAFAAIKQGVSGMRAAHLGDMDRRCRIRISRTADRSGVDDKSSVWGVNDARQMRVRAEEEPGIVTCEPGSDRSAGGQDELSFGNVVQEIGVVVIGLAVKTQHAFERAIVAGSAPSAVR
jgi:hypothetical protein